MSAIVAAFRRFAINVAADHAQTCRYGSKYHTGQGGSSSLAIDLVQKVGLQMTTAVRLMQAFEEAKFPLLPQFMSRMIRHVYAAEVHWRSRIDPGLSIVHGCGLVISHAAKIGPGCLLFQNVTLGESMDPTTREIGAPTLGRNVHIGPGATLIGPITVGDRTKIMAGAVLTQSVPPDSVVKPAEVVVRIKGNDVGKPSREEASVTE